MIEHYLDGKRVYLYAVSVGVADDVAWFAHPRSMTETELEGVLAAAHLQARAAAKAIEADYERRFGEPILNCWSGGETGELFQRYQDLQHGNAGLAAVGFVELYNVHGALRPLYPRVPAVQLQLEVGERP